MAEKQTGQFTGIGGGTGLMELNVIADGPVDDIMPPDHVGLGKTQPPGVIVPAVSRGSLERTSRVETDAAAPSAAAAPDMLHMVRAAFRGRYPLIIILGLLLGGTLGYLAWYRTPPTYVSEGLMRIAYTLPQVQQETDQNQPVPMFETFMQSQKTMIASHRIIDNAAKDPIWKANGCTPPKSPDAYYSDSMIVDIKPRSELIRVTITDSDAKMAAAAVTAVVNAYKDWYDSEETQADQQRLGVLVKRQDALTQQIDQITTQMRAKAHDYGTTKLDGFYDALSVRRAKLESALTDVHMAMAGAVTQVTPNAAIPSTAASLINAVSNQTGDLTAEQIAAVDPVMREYWDEQVRLQAELDRLTPHFGPSHPMVIPVRQDLENAKLRVRKYAELYRQSRMPTVQVSADALQHPETAATRPTDALWATETALSNLLNKTKEEVIAVGNAKLDLDQMQLNVDALRSELSLLNHRIEVLRGEGALGGRLSVFSAGEISLVPSTNHRREIIAAASMAGLCVPAGAIFLLSLVNRRYRYWADAATDATLGDVPLLGIMPEIKAQGRISEQMLGAGYSVHQLRVLLGTRAARWAKRSYLFTSSADGDGKTSLAMALAVSFAAAKQKILVIDSDFTQRGLTRGFHAENQAGLYESLEDHHFEDKLLEAAPFLYLLPAGRVGPSDACAISAGSIRAVLDQASKEFDVILIDTGPILGSLEAAIIAQEVDGVILAIGRGQQSNLVSQAVARLHALGANVVGTVFNRAKMEDFQASASPATKASGLPIKELDQQAAEVQRRFSQFGNLVRAAAVTVPKASIER